MWATRQITKKIKYSYVDDEDKENLVARNSDDKSENAESEDSEIPYGLGRERHSRRPFVTGNITGIVVLLLLYGLSIFAAVLGTLAVQNRGNILLKKTSAYSPVLDKLHIPLVKKKIDATLFPDPANPNHIYRMPPSPEVDAAWERIAHIGMHSLTRHEVEGIGKNATECAKTQLDWGYGPDTYMAEIDVFHQLHCLNSLRKTNILHYDYYWGKTWGYEPPVMFESHVDHCIDILRQNIMCNADVEMLTYNWRLTQHNPFPDIGAHKVCRDFDALVRWQEEVELKDEPAKWAKIVKHPDAVDLPMPPHLNELVATSHSADGLMLKKLTGITRPDDCHEHPSQ
ncbi:putative tat pathway signal sequence protein [Phaeoacremonium minimum UCRPA7]|uniref:Putative tat pathway signal sequence protein n=1 Tax=Phaeoacremonium minimum (strain UCR-PA7) TaxID=1286976 RepID=R8BHS1_PHAM7|nr:putative tat pathway signal sequence protein [Phaeoacremonium minimum UCRPA7]EON98885.1 putative tat pathway signal sequence protein [Phaeoacremonium minimum UCRPA7]